MCAKNITSNYDENNEANRDPPPEEQPVYRNYQTSLTAPEEPPKWLITVIFFEPLVLPRRLLLEPKYNFPIF
jgi:hypothetical protein